MTKCIVGLIVAFALAAGPVQADELTIPQFRSEIAVRSDASIAVTETITANFPSARHGLYRTIPFRYQPSGQPVVAVPIAIEAVTQDGATIPYTVRPVGGAVVVKIGDPGRTITGRHVYAIRYTAQAAVNFFSDHDELYWNVTGQDWPSDPAQVEAVVTVPAGVAATDLRATCYTGRTYGSTERACQSEAGPGQARFAASQALTIVVGWPTGIVTKPGNYDQLRHAGTTVAPVRPALPYRTVVVLILANVALPLLAAWFLLWWWMRHGRDPLGRRALMVEYDPPPGLTPAETGVVMDERADLRDVNATLIDLAVRGYLRIRELDRPAMLGFGHQRDYALERRKDYVADRTLAEHERLLLDGLFADGPEQKLSALKGTFAQHILDIQKSLYRTLVTRGYFVSNPRTVRNIFLMVGAVILFVGFYLFSIRIYTLPLVALMFFLTSRTMPQRTPRGAEAHWQARGFKEYLAKAEKYRLHWQEKENIFERFLPYAMVFGVAEKWSRALAEMARRPPDWYSGQSGHAFNSLVLWSALSDLTAATTKSFAPPAAGGQSGFGGGGFSGGGFGGGGGGSW